MKSEHKTHNTKNIVAVPQENGDIVSGSDNEEDSIAVTLKDKNVPVKKPVSQLRLDSIKNARIVRLENLKTKKAEDEESKKLIERAYHAEIEASLIKSTLPKYAKSIKKQILEKLKQQKLLELKKQYGYKSSESDDSSDDSSSSEELVLKRTKKPIKVVKVSKDKEVVPPKKGLLETYAYYGF